MHFVLKWKRIKTYDNPLSVVIYSFWNKRCTEESESEDDTQLHAAPDHTRADTREPHESLYNRWPHLAT